MEYKHFKEGDIVKAIPTSSGHYIDSLDGDSKYKVIKIETKEWNKYGGEKQYAYIIRNIKTDRSHYTRDECLVLVNDCKSKCDPCKDGCPFKEKP